MNLGEKTNYSQIGGEHEDDLINSTQSIDKDFINDNIPSIVDEVDNSFTYFNSNNEILSTKSCVHEDNINNTNESSEINITSTYSDYLSICLYIYLFILIYLCIYPNL